VVVRTGGAKACDAMVCMSSLLATPTVSDASGILQRFHPAIRTWFERRFPDGPTEAQTGGWPAIVGGQNTLVCAPTGSGKTLAGFLAAIDALYRAHEAGQAIEGVTRVVYPSPLKALAVDVHTNLEQPLAEIAEVARELGYEPAPVTAAVRTGDSASPRESVERFLGARQGLSPQHVGRRPRAT
jgi:ATP-dependent helicase Lhr and Lhr-like helicase